MKMLYSIISLAAAPAVVSWSSEQCHHGPRELLNTTEGQGFSSCFGSVIDLDTDAVPLEITTVSSDGLSVSFEVTQGFATSSVSKLGVHYYKSDSEIMCDVRTSAGVDWTSPVEYTAVCDANAKAEVKVYLYLCGRATDECEYCETPSDDLADYYELSFEVLCKEPCRTSTPSSGPTTDPSSGPTTGPTSRPTLRPTPGPPSSPYRPTIAPTSLPATVGDNITNSNTAPSGSLGDPHFKTWKNEHFEYHGQCDMILAKDGDFAGGLGIDAQIRTKLVRFWSYIKNAAIRIGDDILEVEGSGDPEDADTHYWFNLEYQGKIRTLGGFPLTIKKGANKRHKRTFEIDLSSMYPNQKIVLSTYKEFVRVDFENGTEESFGNTVGMLGNFKTGETLARDGVTVLDDFLELGSEWQVLPLDDMLFHSVEQPQFPKKCLEPEDPRGERRRRLGESSITEEQAEDACSSLKDAADRKDCVYDVLATQDLDMVGAF